MPNSISLRNFIVGALLLLSVLSCQKKESKNVENEKIIADNYTLMVPKDFEKTNKLNELAKIQFQKVDEDLYFIVLEETKQSFADAVKLKIHDTTPNLYGYFKVVTNHFKEITKNLKVNDVGRTKIDSCNAIIFSMFGQTLDNGKSVFYRYALIEDDKNYYQIMSWTNIHHKEKLIGRMDNIIHSFKMKK
ncbi:hypothetical protein [Flavobacterium urocaniciphilum]|uniref:Uncharacterized protein n=1 Tax=Flavobacterium urocaniciphilum TaxID=1299341 RepID=A0A1H9D480_9FLAO|nr:hypothetical protein [Flavobacterium urocaniciphilum]SEQ08159.1 hypothetical protein SAMN05444005_10618 [Flavobacterium urocaniciphilum]